MKKAGKEFFKICNAMSSSGLPSTRKIKILLRKRLYCEERLRDLRLLSLEKGGEGTGVSYYRGILSYKQTVGRKGGSDSSL